MGEKRGQFICWNASERREDVATKAALDDIKIRMATSFFVLNLASQ